MLSVGLFLSNNIYLMGWSSSCTMILTLTLNLLAKNCTLIQNKIKSLFAFSPWVDLTLKISRSDLYQKQQNLDKTAAGADLLEMMAKAYLPEGVSGIDPMYAPLLRNTDMINLLPKTYVVTGGSEVLFGDAIFLTDTLQRVNVPTSLVILDGQTHNYMVFDSLSQDGVYVPSIVSNILTEKQIEQMKNGDLGLVVKHFNQ
jgi:acetyl esterase/lipase